MIKILYVCRLYSGFEESIKTGVWNPKGAPTIAHMIKHLDADKAYDIEIILTQKNHSSQKFPKINKIKELNAHVTVLPGPSTLPDWLWKFQTKINDIYQCFFIWRQYQTLKPDLVYCDRVNIFSAAMLSRFTNAKVIWRVMGVLQEMRDALRHKGLRSHILKWLWNSPFEAVICSIDGSDGKSWLTKALNTNTPYFMLLNGVEKNQKADPSITLPENTTNILFVGRLEPMKGTEEFIEAFGEIVNHNVSAIIAGDGSLKPKMKEQALSMGLEKNIHFLGSVTPAQLKHIRQNCHLYISLNTHGNLTNVNLEALSDYLPTIIPASSGDIDKDTDELIPQDVFYRFGRVGDKQALVAAIEKMMDVKIRAAYRKSAKACASKVLPSWDERVAQELAIYEDCKPYDLAVVIADLGSGGAQKVALSLVNDCVAEGQRVALITLSDKEADFHAVPEDVKRISLSRYQHHKRLNANIGRIIGLRQVFKELAPQRVVSFIAPTNVLAIWACMGLKTRLTISERNDPARQSFGKLWDGLRRISYRFADQITANSLNAVENLKDYVPEKKLYFVPNALAQPPKSTVKKEKTVLIVGRLHPQKNHKVLLEAFAEVYKSYPDWKLVIVGDGPLKADLQTQAQTLKIDSSVQFEGTVKDPYKLYMKASIFVLPSLHEGTPNALLEAMSCGGLAPIVSDACEGALPYIKHGESGFVVPVNDISALTLQMGKLMEDMSVCQKIGKAAQKEVEPLYERSTADLWLDVLKKAS